MHTYLVLFPGAWGNRDEETVRWWFRHMINFFTDRLTAQDDLTVVPMTYRGRTMEAYAEHCLAQMRAVKIRPNDRVIGVGYSMGGQIMRLFAERWSEQFSDKIMIASGGPDGMKTIGFLRGFMAITKAFLLGALTGKVKLTKTEEVYRLFFGDFTAHGLVKETCLEILEHSHAEAFWPCVELAVWPFRKSLWGLPGKVNMVIARNDILFGDEADRPGNLGEEPWNMITVDGGHACILDRDSVHPALNQIDWSQ